MWLLTCSDYKIIILLFVLSLTFIQLPMKHAHALLMLLTLETLVLGTCFFWTVLYSPSSVPLSALMAFLLVAVVEAVAGLSLLVQGAREKMHLWSVSS